MLVAKAVSYGLEREDELVDGACRLLKGIRCTEDVCRVREDGFTLRA